MAQQGIRTGPASSNTTKVRFLCLLDALPLLHPFSYYMMNSNIISRRST